MLQFLKQHQHHRREAQDLITRGMTKEVIIGYENFYKAYLDPKFTVNRACGSCIGDMVQRVWRWYDKQVEEGILLDFAEVVKEPVETSKVETKKKRK
jgi:hypothetical protein